MEQKVKIGLMNEDLKNQYFENFDRGLELAKIEFNNEFFMLRNQYHSAKKQFNSEKNSDKKEELKIKLVELAQKCNQQVRAFKKNNSEIYNDLIKTTDRVKSLEHYSRFREITKLMEVK
ncbi:hypothetical protein NPA07_04985 [Mycoplasmopsis caviae]|nr:hypothetical protein [Mycoplasmopsis caviae]UUD35131.1 hypothetical protein NPA07_04985 [Mycoplasmopsis caviae]